MKKITLIFLLTLFFNVYSQEKESIKHFEKSFNSKNTTTTIISRCSTDEYELYLQRKDPKRLTTAQFEKWFTPIVQKYKNITNNKSENNGIITIPVVVHVIHNGDAYGSNENISDEQVQSQITVMNQDFRRIAGTPGFNSNPIGADIQIEFALAKVDPNGNPTNGINRVNLCRENYNVGGDPNQIQDLIDTQVKPQTIWDSTQYMNMWSVNWDGSGLLGYAQFPSSGTTTANTDGVVAGHSYFGSRTLYSAGTYSGNSYDKGRTMTHEIGHFLGLFHTFQGGCTGAGDSCNDTPAIMSASSGCPTGRDSCPSEPGLDMIENYMDYSDDSCMNIFTQNQKSRIIAVMNTFPRRTTLKTSIKDQPITLFPNDAEIKIENVCNQDPDCSNPNIQSPLKVISLHNRGTSLMTSATISYNFTGGTNYTFNWTGSLATNKFAYITLPNTGINGTLNVSITNVNGLADQRSSNNNGTKTYNNASTTLDNHNYTTFTFNLIGDPFGEETTWQLTNQTGALLYSGGPYTNTGVAGTQALVTNQTWNLPINGCYTFTISDSFSDGLSGSSNGGVSNNDAGSWTIKTNSGALTINSGSGNFGASQNYRFTNNTLSSELFDLLENISLYPNPTKSTLNITMPLELKASNSSYTIYNSLGQTISSHQMSGSDLSINTSEFSNGIYFIKLNFENSSKTLRFIKN